MDTMGADHPFHVDEDFHDRRKRNEELRDQERRFHTTGLEGGINRARDTEQMQATRERTVAERIDDWLAYHAAVMQGLRGLRGNLSTDYLNSPCSRLGPCALSQNPPY